MALTVNTNLAAMRASNSLNKTQMSLSHTLAKISGGLRVTKAADDAAGMAVASNLGTVARSGKQAIRNANDGISIIQTAEGATREVQNILDRMRELAVQSASETLANDERSYLNAECEQLSEEIDRIAQATEFNGLSLADTTPSQLLVQVGVTSGSESQITINLGDLRVSTLNVDATDGVDDVDLSTATDARLAIDTIDAAITAVNDVRAGYGAVQNRIESAIANMVTYVESLSAAKSQIMDTDYAHETSEMTKYQVMQQAGTAALAQARTINQSVISLLS